MKRAAAFAAWVAVALAGCAPFKTDAPSREVPPGPAATSPRADSVAPNANLFVQGIAPIPRGLADDVARYNDFRGHSFVDWHPVRNEMIVAFRKPGGATPQLFRLLAPLGRLEPLTDFDEPVVSATWEPLAGESFVFERSSGGDEAAQLFRLDLATRQVTQVSEPGMRHEIGRWLHRSSRLLYTSLPLDRTAAGGSRGEITTRLTLVDPRDPASRRPLAELPGGGWDVGDVSWDDRTVSLTRYLSAGDSEIHLLDLATGALRQVLPAPGSAGTAAHFAGRWRHDGSGFFVVSDRRGEFRELMLYSLGDGSLAPVTHRIRADVTGVDLSANGRTLAVRVNIDGRAELRFFDAASLHELPAPLVADGSVVAARFHPRLPLLAYALTGSDAPVRIATLDPSTGRSQPWTAPAAPAGVDTSRFGKQRIVRWKSFDGREISGLLSQPPARFTGRRPVIVDIHGGPEAQASFGFLGRLNYFVEELGIAVLRPNVRGSAGFGKTFMALDNGMKREDAVKDIGALLDWIATEPGLDSRRVLVQGGSYGGYMSLAVAVHYADRIAGAIDVVGISDFATFLKNTESYRRDLRRAEYGDERDPAMRAFMDRISPLRNAAKITKPLFVVQGRNDPRVPWTEAEQIVARVRASGTRVWYLRAENEGHGFVRKENADFLFYATVMFVRETLLK